MVFGYAASFLFIVCLCIGIYLFGYAARKADALYVISLEVILGCLLLTPLILLTDKISFLELFTKPEKEEWLWLSLAGILVFIGGNFFTLMNLKIRRRKDKQPIISRNNCYGYYCCSIVFR
ncbi:MAG: hypothetical protein WKF59_20460 [Chitinophagaceae bacterium]